MEIDSPADGILRIAAVHMAEAVRGVTIERGIDPREAALVAPISGIVSKRHALPGEKVAAEQELLTIVDLRKLEMAGSVGTHEVGHVVGLADLYQSSYSQLTMYGYAAPAETLKRSLEHGDILGTQRLYGE